MSDYFKRVQKRTPTRFWINNVTGEEAELAIAAGAVGCTQNPSYTWKIIEAVGQTAAFKATLDAALAAEANNEKALVALQRALVGDIAGHFMPLYNSSGGRLGYVSVQGDPFHEDYRTIVEQGRYNRQAGKNIMVKVPVTEDGLKAIEELLAEGTPINATEVMCVRQAMDVCDAYDRATKGMKNPPVVYFSHIAGIFDEYLNNYVNRNNVDIDKDALWQAGVAVGKKIMALTQARDSRVGFIAGGARGLHHFTEMVGGAISVTINWKGTADALLAADAPVVDRFSAPVAPWIIDELCQKLPDFDQAYWYSHIEPHEYEEFGPVALFRSQFEAAWKKALAYIGEARK